MAKRKIPQFTSLRQEREFWQTHDVFEVFEEEHWRMAAAGELQLEPVYVSRVDRRGATLRVPGAVLTRIGRQARIASSSPARGSKTSDRIGLKSNTN